jgi:hypothetical protein
MENGRVLAITRHRHRANGKSPLQVLILLLPWRPAEVTIVCRGLSLTQDLRFSKVTQAAAAAILGVMLNGHVGTSLGISTD